MWYHLVITIAVMALLMGGYYLIQFGLRRVSPDIGSECDVLETRWGCGTCMFHGKCRHDVD